VAAGPQKEAFFAQMGVEGPMARNVRDLALLLDVQSGHDPRSPLSLDSKEAFLDGLADGFSTARIAWLGDAGGYLATEPGLLDICETALRRFEAGGLRVEPFVPDVDFEALWRAFVTIRHATSGCNLKLHWDDPAKRARLKPEAIFEVEGALNLTAPQIASASTVRTAWHLAVLGLFERFDFLALPTAAVFPFDVRTPWPKEIAGRKMDSYHRWLEVSMFATLAGCPAVALPAGFDAQGRPIGLQLIGPPRGDLAVLRAAALCEKLTPWTSGAT
jgi:amidase